MLFLNDLDLSKLCHLNNALLACPPTTPATYYGTFGSPLTLDNVGLFCHYEGDLWYFGQVTGSDPSWVNVSSTGTGSLPTGTEGQTLYNNAGTWTAHSGLFWDDTYGCAGLGITASLNAKLHVKALAGIGGYDPVITNCLQIDDSADVNLLTVKNTGEAYLLGPLGLGVLSPTASLHLPAGTASAATAPFKFTAGVNLTTAEAGAFEWDGVNLYVSQTTGPTRKTINYIEEHAVLPWSATVVVPFDEAEYRTCTLEGDTTFESHALSPAKAITIQLINDQLTAVDLTFPANWRWLRPPPATLASGKTTILSMTSFGFTDILVFAVAALVLESNPLTQVIALSGDLAFGDVIVDATSERTLTIENNGTGTLTISSIDYPSGFSGAWSGTIASGLTQEVVTTFSPIAATSYSGNLTVNSDASSGTNTRAMSGTGILDPCANYFNNLVAYYPLDELTISDQFLDSVGISHLNNPNAACEVAVTGNRGGSAKQINQTWTADTILNATSEVFKLSNLTVGFTLRMWYKLSTYESSGDIPLYLCTIADPVHWAYCDMMVYRGGVSNNWWCLSIAGDTAHETYCVVPTDTNWHRLIIWFDPTTKTVGMQLDNDAPGTATNEDPTPYDWYGQSQLFLGTLTSAAIPGLQIDEVAFWREKILTADERLCDWNSGGEAPRPTAPSLPTAPQNMTASDGTQAGFVRITWDAVEGATIYSIRRGMSIVGTSAGLLYDDVPPAMETEYSYYVYASNAAGTSDPSTVNTGSAALPPPAIPQTVSASDGTHADFVRITWDAVAEATSYNVLRDASVIGTPVDHSYDDYTPANNVSYSYTVQAVNTAGTSASSTANTGYSSDPVPLDEYLATSCTPNPAAVLRNDHEGWVGVTFQVTEVIQVTHLGRWVLDGNTLTHRVKLVATSGGTSTNVAGASVTVTTSGKTVGQFEYVALAAPVQLDPSVDYSLVSEETVGGDYWYNSTDALLYLAANPAILGVSAVWMAPGDPDPPVPNYISGGGTATVLSYVPVNLKFTQ